MHSLEESKLFPIIAWGTIFFFGAFTLHLAFTLKHLETKIDSYHLEVEQLRADTTN